MPKDRSLAASDAEIIHRSRLLIDEANRLLANSAHLVPRKTSVPRPAEKQPADEAPSHPKLT